MKLNFKEKYLIILVVLCFVSLGFYYSYAIFVSKQLQENVLVVNLPNNRVELNIDGKDKISIKANSSLDFKINLNNEHSTNYYYIVLVKGLQEGVKVSSNDETRGEILSLNKKSILVHANNTTKNDITLEFIVKVNNEPDIEKEYGYYYINDVDSFDHSGANVPDIKGLNLLPVSYKKTSDKEGYWYKADETNQTDLWYSYENGIWANAILLSSDNYNKYKSKDVGTEIDNNDILSFFVWIPRFKYYIVNNSSYTSYERVNNIIFEKDNESTGTVECFNQISKKDDSHVFSEVCNDEYYDHIYDNLSTYTHPSFKDKNGFWVNKFLMGNNQKSNPNMTILKKNISEANVISNKYNSHVLTNMEYGAIILLSNSAYGKTANKMYSTDNNNTFTRIYANTYEYEVTGCSSEYNIHSNSFETKTTKTCVPYNDLTDYSHIQNSVKYPVGYSGAGASSTGTIYGVYDLASPSGEIVSAYVSNEDGNVDAKTNIYDIYSYNDFIGKVTSSSNIYNLYRYKLGDAIREHFRNFNEEGMWNNGVLNQNKNSGILVRGANNSIYSVNIEDTLYEAPFRLVLMP